jgi:hypothetical protein
MPVGEDALGHAADSIMRVWRLAVSPNLPEASLHGIRDA